MDLNALTKACLETLGPAGIRTAPEDIAPFCLDWRGRKGGHSPLILLPANRDECSRVVALCAQARQPISPQGGNTGLVLGGVPNGEVVLSLQRMNKIRRIDPLNDAMIVEAGAILANVQQAALDADRLFPLSLASEGSAQIGGLCSTNAGGVAVLRYGMMRDLVLGLEVVLADGRIWDGLTALRKDNTGYDLKQLFLGAEGTLGIITAVTLKLFPRPRSFATAWLAVEGLAQAIDCLALAKSLSGGAVTAFEAMPDIGIELVQDQFPDSRSPLSASSPWHILMEMSFGRVEGAQETLTSALEAAFADGLINDAVIASNEAQRLAFWNIRERLPLAEKAFGAAIKHDVSTPISDLPRFYEAANRAVHDIVPNAAIIAFGHLGDGNLHYNVAPAPGMDPDRVFSRTSEITHAIHDCVMSFHGSISAEHGIGRQKQAELPMRKSAIAMEMMHVLKQALDPQGILNPGRILAATPD